MMTYLLDAVTEMEGERGYKWMPIQWADHKGHSTELSAN